MPIEERTVVDLREQMALMALDERYTVSEVAERFGVARPTVRKWRERYQSGGRAGLVDLSHAPRTCPHRTNAEIEQLIVEDRERWEFGSKKILKRLQEAHPLLEFPKRSTIDAILARHGLVKRKRPRRERAKSPFRRPFEATEPGQLTTIDHKGEFRLRNGRYCYPLTIADSVSRYVLACEALDSTSFERAWPVIQRVFAEHGLPEAMHSDNGPPFGATNGRYSRLSVELMRLDVQPVFSRPGVPQDNGRHERMHRDLKAWLIGRVMSSFREQQTQFNNFLQMFNFERPHESLEMKRPATIYTPSARPLPSRRPAPAYEAQWEKRKVSQSGEIRWKQQSVFLGRAFAGETIALEETDTALWTVRYYKFAVGKFDEDTLEFL